MVAVIVKLTLFSHKSHGKFSKYIHVYLIDKSIENTTEQRAIKFVRYFIAFI